MYKLMTTQQKSKKKGNKHYKKIIVIIVLCVLCITMWDIKTPANTNGVKSITQAELEYIHDMTNTVIVSRDIWGKQEINKKSIAQAKEYTKGRNPQIYNYLVEWENGNFSNSVAFHNHVWKLLDGEIGFARGLNQKGIDRAIKNLNK